MCVVGVNVAYLVFLGGGVRRWLDGAPLFFERCSEPLKVLIVASCRVLLVIGHSWCSLLYLQIAGVWCSCEERIQRHLKL